jgi:hypothetical protein
MKYISSFFAISWNHKNKNQKNISTMFLLLSSLLAYSILTYNLHYSLAIYALPSRGGSGGLDAHGAAPLPDDPSPQMNIQRNEQSQNKFARPSNNPIQPNVIRPNDNPIQPNVIRPNTQCSTIVDGNSRRSTTATGVNANNCNNINGQVIINPGSSSSSSSLTINNGGGVTTRSYGNFGTTVQEPSQYSIPMVVSYLPIANAGYSQIVHSNDYVVLDGSGSYDPYGNALYYLWVQPSGQNPIALWSNYNQPAATFTAPQVTEITTLTFGLIVNNGKQNSNPSYTTVTIYP